MAEAGASDSAPAVGTSQRIYTACITCRKRKKRCDGVRPTCGLCAKLHLPCVFIDRKTRGPGKSKENIQKLEERLQQFESSTNASASASAGTRFNDIWGQAHEHNGDQSSSQRPETQNPLTPGSTGHSTSGDQAQIAFGGSRGAHPTLPGFGFAGFTTALNAARQQIESQSNLAPFPRTVFNSLPPYERMSELIKSAWEELPLHGLLFTEDYAQHLIKQQYKTGPDRCGDDPARWAIVNTLFATALLHKATDDYFKTVLIPAWGFFKNAFSVFPELMIRGTDVSACEAILAMAVFARQSADARISSQLISAVSRLVCTLGLHKKHEPRAESISSQEMDRERRVFLFAYILDADMVHRYDLFSEFKSCDMYMEPDLTLITSGWQTQEMLLKTAELASLRLHAHEMLPSDRSRSMAPERMKLFHSLNGLLDGWLSSLPGNLSLSSREAANDASQIRLLHLAYLTTKMVVNVALTRLERVTRTPESIQNAGVKINEVDSSVQWPWEECVSAAHHVIMSMRGVSSQPFYIVWQMLCYPLAATLLLLSAVVGKPENTCSRTHLSRIEEFIKLLEQIQTNGSDVKELLAFCTKVHGVASLAVDNVQRDPRRIVSSDTGLPSPGTLAQIESLRQKLSGVDNWMHLAQGLLSNMPMQRKHANEIFGDIFGEVSSDKAYGMCVPAVMESHHQTFAFGP